MNNNIYDEITLIRDEIEDIISFHDDFFTKLNNDIKIDDKILEEDKFILIKDEEVAIEKDLSNLLSVIVD